MSKKNKNLVYQAEIKITGNKTRDGISQYVEVETKGNPKYSDVIGALESLKEAIINKAKKEIKNGK